MRRAIPVSDAYERIGALLRERRTRLRLSQDVVAAKLGITKASVSLHESGRVEIPTARLIAYARVLELDPILLFRIVVKFDLTRPPGACEKSRT